MLQRFLKAGGPVQSASEQGTIIVEFAISFVFILVLLTGIFDYGASIHEARTMMFAAREGAREASRNLAVNRKQDTWNLLGSAAQNTAWDYVYIQALNLTMSALTTAGYQAADYELSVNAEPYVLPSQGTNASMVRVNLRRAASSSKFKFQDYLTFRPCVTVAFKIEQTIDIGARSSGTSFSCN